MKLSAPLYRLKREAKLLARRERIPLHEALDRVAAREGFRAWSLLASRVAAARPSRKIYAGLRPGDMVLLGARPGHGKTLLGLELAVEAMEAGQRGAFFSLVYNGSDMSRAFESIRVDPSRYADRFVFDDSDGISADHVVRELASAPPGTLAVIDYLQVLDQKRENPELQTQVRTLQAFARARGAIVAFVSQIDRRFDASGKAYPGLEDVRMPNPLDLRLFDKTCFLNGGRVRFAAVG